MFFFIPIGILDNGISFMLRLVIDVTLPLMYYMCSNFVKMYKPYREHGYYKSAVLSNAYINKFCGNRKMSSLNFFEKIGLYLLGIPDMLGNLLAMPFRLFLTAIDGRTDPFANAWDKIIVRQLGNFVEHKSFHVRFDDAIKFSEEDVEKAKESICYKMPTPAYSFISFPKMDGKPYLRVKKNDEYRFVKYRDKILDECKELSQRASLCTTPIEARNYFKNK